MEVRTALESLPGLTALTVTRDFSQTASLGTGSATQGSGTVTTDSSLLSVLSAGDLVWVNGEAFKVHATNTFDASTLSLALATDATQAAVYAGTTASGLEITGWANGYTYDVFIHSTDGGAPGAMAAPQAIHPPMHSLTPSDSAVTVTGGGCTTCFNLNNLVMTQSRQPYYVRVAAVNKVGQSAWSSTAQEVPRQIAGAPQDVSLLVVSDKSLEVVWSPPISDGGDDVTAYYIEWDTTSTFNSISTTQAIGSATVSGSAISGSPPFHYFITHMDLPVAGSAIPDGTTLFVRVSAVNSVAFSDNYDTNTNVGNNDRVWELSTPLSATTAFQLPDALDALSVSTLTGDSIRIWITDPSKTGGYNVSRYEIEWDTSSGFDSGSLALNVRGV